MYTEARSGIELTTGITDENERNIVNAQLQRGHIRGEEGADSDEDKQREWDLTALEIQLQTEQAWMQFPKSFGEPGDDLTAARLDNGSIYYFNTNELNLALESGITLEELLTREFH